MKNEYESALENFFNYCDEKLTEQMIVEEGFKDALVKMKNAVLAFIKKIIDACKRLMRKVSGGKDKQKVMKSMQEAEKLQKVVEKTNDPKVVQQAQKKMDTVMSQLDISLANAKELNNSMDRISEMHDNEWARLYAEFEESLFE